MPDVPSGRDRGSDRPVTDHALASPRDAIVSIELTLNEHHEVADVIACLRAGALSWQASPCDDGRILIRDSRVQHVLDVADELSEEAALVLEEREAFYQAEAKRTERESRERAKGSR